MSAQDVSASDPLDVMRQLRQQTQDGDDHHTFFVFGASVSLRVRDLLSLSVF